ncbi:rfaE bifunctional protein kinase chain/domain [Sporomusaceae bacterium BoRhaA]|uniref:bifunctional heptose 7-phosphate kinase/heptose 1-phosphate adenyltransferase n=1 Tax=Pelorhabdus rhamnosifermentans TaxID=2772457 RepID=UPI001C060987|nr:PfkB family carbohydrate kinase [Pelorhabdus rhamnosifermentans]MBU2699012.1 rfaE bifunctional protein kinase chain/domain [Pelorhabdus rhamnosifermentans]
MKRIFLDLIDHMKNKKIMVIGDMVADSYLEGKISRISREAPVLILEHTGEKVVPGGAANVVHNGATLLGKVYAVGVIGLDSAGELLNQRLQQVGVNTDGFIIDEERPTISKQRIMAGGLATVRQQVVRIDKESKKPLSSHTEQKLLEYIRRTLPHMDAVVMSDYGSYTVFDTLKKNVIDWCNERSIPCMVDSRYDILSYTNVTLVKQNESEAANAAGLPDLTGQRLQEAGEKLLEQLKARAVLITQGAEGMTLFEQQGKQTHIPVTNISEVYDVSGAGDTVVVTMMLAIAAGADFFAAAKLANVAAGIVVRKSGTATTNPLELKQAIGDQFDETR